MRVEAAEPDEFQQFGRLPAALARAESLHLEAERDVVDHALPRKQRVLLKHEAAFGMRTVDGFIVDGDHALRRGDVARYRAEQGRLAAARRAEHADELTGRDIDVETVERGDACMRRTDFYRKAAHADACRRGGGFNGDAAHRRVSCSLYHGVSATPRRLTSTLLPIPSAPISAMPTTISG